MSEMLNIVLEPRETKGKEANRKVRSSGYIPCVVYGPDYLGSLPGKVKASEIGKVVASSRWETQTIQMTFPGGKDEMCLMREVQKDILNGQILHIDFVQLVKGHRINVNIPVKLVGRDECPGVKLGGVIDHLLREISMEVLPGQIPESIVIDVSTLGLGDQIQVKDLPVPEEAEVLAEPDEVVVAVMIPRGIGEDEEPETEEKEVEVVAKGKAKDEEAE